MTTVFDVPADPLIRKLGEKLKADPKFDAPPWAKFAKTGIHREKTPTDPNWWQPRVASIARKVYLHGPIGVIHLSAEYGGTRDRGSKPNKARLGSRSIVRTALKQLETAGYVQAIKGKGRILAPAGRKLLDATAHEIAKELEVKIPALAKY
ncbi:MAG TPA: 30S ribosomal protein S19e [Candidatus Thermoplasmatota archaeon]|nr:30S ribosomal protein S19e [Candidatus Thermoplasmatota archaeon]